MNRRSKNTRLFSAAEIIFFAAFSLCAILIASYLYLQAIASEKRDQQTNNAERIITKISSELGNATGVMSSLITVQKVLDDPYGDQLDDFARQAIQQSDLISSVSRYERVTAKQIPEFARKMSESGLYNFSLAELDEEGKRQRVIAKDFYYPLIWRQPIRPRTAMMIGVDLSAKESLFSLIEGSEASNTISVTEIPAEWPTRNSSDLLLIHPTYFGRYLPESSGPTLSESNGGVLMGLNLSSFINNQSILIEGYSIEIATVQPTDSTLQAKKISVVGKLENRTDSGQHLESLFKGIEVSSMPIVGNTSLLISVSSNGGFTSSEALRAALVTLGICTLMSLLFLIIYRIRLVSAASTHARETALVTLKAIGDSVVTTDSNGTITYANPSSEILLQAQDASLIGRNIVDAIKFKQRGESPGGNVDYTLTEALKSEESIILPELNLCDSISGCTTVSSSLSPIRGESNSSSQGHVLVMRDVTAERELTNELEFLAKHDSLTKIANRYFFEQRLEEMIETSISKGQTHALCYIDLDQFKTINDTCGHSAGDNLLVKVSNELTEQIRETDVLARLGGDEFGLLITNCSEDQAMSLSNRIYEHFQNMYFQHGDDVFAVRASIGFVLLNGHFDSIEDVMAAADLACYSAKDRGRNELHVFNPNNEETTDRRSEMMWLPKLQMALRSNNFELFAQPIVGIKDSSNSLLYNHYEILLRLRADDGELITPFQLIIAAERYNLMRDIDRWVIEKAINQIAELKYVLGNELPKFSINISGQSTIDTELAEFIEQMLERTGVDPGTLIFEITETSAITNMNSAVKLVDALHDIGCALALDDFGSGVSSFGYLKTLKVDYLKIDGQFIKNIDTSDVDREMVKCMQAVADILEIETIAEFVENANIITVLEELNVGYGQGYHYSKPHPLDDLIEILNFRKAA